MIGFLLATLGNVIINEVCEIIQIVAGLIKTKISVKISRDNLEIAKINDEAGLEVSSVAPIGFAIPTEEEDNEGEFEDDEE